MKQQDLEKIADLVAARIQPPVREAAQPVPETAQPGKRKKRTRDRIPAYISGEEMERLLAVIQDPRDKAIFAVAYYRGLRASEIGLLTFGDFQQAAGRLVLRRLKGSRGGQYRLTEIERNVLRAWVRVRGSEAGPLFASRNHAPISRSWLHRLMRRYCELAGIEPAKAHMHALKHGCATALAERDGDVLAIQDHMGHIDVQNTMRYIRVTSRKRDDFAGRLEGSGWGSKKPKK